MERPFDQHLDDQELQALVPEAEPTQALASAESFVAASCHVAACQDCAQKVAQYRSVLKVRSKAGGTASAGAECPRDVDWYEVVVGLWPEFKARQLIMHAALCDHCGPLLRAAARLEAQPTPEEESFLAQLAAPKRPSLVISPARSVPATTPWWTFAKWAIPAALAIVVTALIALTPRPIEGASFAEIAASTHQQHAEGALALDFRSDSQQQLNDWLEANLPFPLPLPTAPEVPGEHRPYQLEGARLVEVRGKPAVYISYVAENDPVSLLVTPDSSATPSGGVVVDYKKVSFHYRMVAGYKVVTWSLKGRTYALVSHESNATQRSCMVCHSAMGDRDLTNTPTPLAERLAKPAFQ